MATKLLITLLLATAALYVTATPYCDYVLDYTPPCPLNKGKIWYCYSGKAYDGCRIGKPFPWGDCGKQCIDARTSPVEYASSNWETHVPAPEPAPECDYQPPCPKGKGKVWYCLSGKAYNGCSVGKPFPSVDCSEQCTDDGYKEVEWASSNWESGPKPAPVCDFKPPCPKGKGKVWYCLSGKAYNGCSVGKPFPGADCYEQCTDDGSKAYEWY